MRPSVFLAAIPFVLGCAQQSELRAPARPSDEPLHVRLYQPAGKTLTYELSEPAYVAIFAVSRGDGIAMIFPHFKRQVYDRSRAGLNHQQLDRSAAWNFGRFGGAYDRTGMLANPDAYYVIASKYPLPTEGMVLSPSVLRSLVGEYLFLAHDLTETWDVLESILVEGLPDDAWASDVYVYWRERFASMPLAPSSYVEYCSDGGIFYTSPLILNNWSCDANRRRTTQHAARFQPSFRPGWLRAVATPLPTRSRS